MASRRRRLAPIVAVSGPSGVGKTRLITRLIRELSARGLSVAVLKRTGHTHDFDVPGKDTELVRRAGAVAAAIQGPSGLAWFGPPAAGLTALALLLPPCDLVLAEGWRDEPVARIEVHRARVARGFLCTADRRVFAVVSDEPPPRRLPRFDADEIGPLADLLVERFLAARRPRARRAGSRRRS